MKSLVFDAGPIISLATNNLLFILEPLKKEFNGKFCITEKVKKELVDRPMEIKKFKFEAIQIQKLIEDSILEVLEDDVVNSSTLELFHMANNTFKAYGHPINLIHYAEMSVIAAAKSMSADAIIIDEKTTRLMIENPRLLLEILRKKLHTSISVNENNLKEFKNRTKEIKIIRSIELAAVAYERGFFNRYITKLPDARKNLLESIMWGVKINGCAVSKDEIGQIIEMEAK